MRRPVLTAQLPPTPCSPDLRERVVRLAYEQNRSIAEVTREALEFFLLQSDSKSISADIQSTKEPA